MSCEDAQQEAEEAVASRIMQSLQADADLSGEAARLSAEDEEFFAVSIFELGLRYSSPKILVRAPKYAQPRLTLRRT